LRGHGLWGGKPGKLAAPEVLRSDLDAILAFVKTRHPDAPVILMGESMGGLLAADFARHDAKGKLAGLVLLAPAFALHPSQLDFGDIGGFSFTDQKLKPGTRHPDWVKARRADKLALPKVGGDYISGIFFIQLDFPKGAKNLTLPLYVAVGGKDEIVDAKATRAAFDAAGTPKASKTWREWDKAYHPLCWDKDTPRLFAEVTSWISELALAQQREHLPVLLQRTLLE